MSVTYYRNPETGLFEQVGPGGATTDTTLSQAGKPADAAAVSVALTKYASKEELNNKVDLPKDTNGSVSTPMAGQTLLFNADGTTYYGAQIAPTNEQAEIYINAWLDEHPEATTTVEDESITPAKTTFFEAVVVEDTGAEAARSNLYNSNAVTVGKTTTYTEVGGTLSYSEHASYLASAKIPVEANKRYTVQYITTIGYATNNDSVYIIDDNDIVFQRVTPVKTAAPHMIEVNYPGQIAFYIEVEQDGYLVFTPHSSEHTNVMVSEGDTLAEYAEYNASQGEVEYVYDFTYETKKLIKAVVNSSDAIIAPSTAVVGQTIIVKTVDENGKPVEWEAVDSMVVASSTVGSTKKFKITVDDSGVISAVEMTS